MIPFAKYHGCGNSFVIAREEDVSGRDFSVLAQEMCGINTGVGADGLILVRSVPGPEMIFYNCDGSRAPMCGNGIRCFANYCYDEGIENAREYDVQTLAGVMRVKVLSTEPFTVEINMGSPVYAPESFGVEEPGGDFLRRTLETSQGEVTVSSCFMGTVHTVVFVEDFNFDIHSLGRELESHPAYTEKTNVNFVKIINAQALEVKTYERGAGLTLACGTGACASVVIGALEGRCQREADVLLPLGTLHIRQDSQDRVFMAGPARRIAAGTYYEAQIGTDYKEIKK